MFEKAMEAMNNDLAEGKDVGGEARQQESPDQAEDSTPEIPELDKLEKVMYKGKEMTREDFERSFMMQSDYTKKTQALAEERKFVDNLNHDLSSVIKNPQLADEFRKIYPEKYHGVLDAVLSQSKTPLQAVKNEQKAEPDQAFMQKFQQLESKLSKFQKEAEEKEVAAIEAQLDATFKTLSKKYPLADEETVLARADIALKQGVKLDDKVWDKLWSAVNDRNQERYKSHYAEQVKQQKQAAEKGKDIAGGGGVPGQAPTKMALKDVKNFMIDDLRGRST